MEDIVNHLGGLASFIGSLTVVGSALMWIYNKFIAKPREKRREQDEEKRQREMMKTIKEENRPLMKSINQLNEWLDESKRDREKLNEIAQKNTKSLGDHKRIIDDHGERILVLETKQGLRTVKYKKGDEDR